MQLERGRLSLSLSLSDSASLTVSLSQVMGHVQASHELNTYLSALLAPSITAIAIIAAAFAVVNFGIVYAPRAGLYADSYLQVRLTSTCSLASQVLIQI